MGNDQSDLVKVISWSRPVREFVANRLHALTLAAPDPVRPLGSGRGQVQVMAGHALAAISRTETRVIPPRADPCLISTFVAGGGPTG